MSNVRNFRATCTNLIVNSVENFDFSRFIDTSAIESEHQWRVLAALSAHNLGRFILPVSYKGAKYVVPIYLPQDYYSADNTVVNVSGGYFPNVDYSVKNAPGQLTGSRLPIYSFADLPFVASLPADSFFSIEDWAESATEEEVEHFWSELISTGYTRWYFPTEPLECNNWLKTVETPLPLKEVSVMELCSFFNDTDAELWYNAHKFASYFDPIMPMECIVLAMVQRAMLDMDPLITPTLDLIVASIKSWMRNRAQAQEWATSPLTYVLVQASRDSLAKPAELLNSVMAVLDEDKGWWEE